MEEHQHLYLLSVLLELIIHERIYFTISCITCPIVICATHYHEYSMTTAQPNNFSVLTMNAYEFH